MRIIPAPERPRYIGFRLLGERLVGNADVFIADMPSEIAAAQPEHPARDASTSPKIVADDLDFPQGFGRLE